MRAPGETMTRQRHVNHTHRGSVKTRIVHISMHQFGQLQCDHFMKSRHIDIFIQHHHSFLQSAETRGPFDIQHHSTTTETIARSMNNSRSEKRIVTRRSRITAVGRALHGTGLRVPSPRWGYRRTFSHFRLSRIGVAAGDACSPVRFAATSTTGT